MYFASRLDFLTRIHALQKVRNLIGRQFTTVFIETLSHVTLFSSDRPNAFNATGASRLATPIQTTLILQPEPKVRSRRIREEESGIEN